MTIMIWLIIVYLFTVVISWKPIHKAVNHPKILDHLHPYNPEFIAWIAVFIPILNIILTIDYYNLRHKETKLQKSINKGAFRNVANVIDEISNREGITEEQRKEYKELADTLRNIKSIDDLKD